MILPTKTLPPDRCLMTVGTELLRIVDNGDLTVSQAWDRLRRSRLDAGQEDIRFDWFCAALDLLHAVGSIRLDDQLIRRVRP